MAGLEKDLAQSQEQVRALTSAGEGSESQKKRLEEELAKAGRGLKEAEKRASEIGSREKDAREKLRKLEESRSQEVKAQTKLTSDLDALQSEKKSLASDLNRAQARAEEAERTPRGGGKSFRGSSPRWNRSVLRYARKRTG